MTCNSSADASTKISKYFHLMELVRMNDLADPVSLSLQLG
jgi:hypothetical protein